MLILEEGSNRNRLYFYEYAQLVHSFGICVYFQFWTFGLGQNANRFLRKENGVCLIREAAEVRKIKSKLARSGAFYLFPPALLGRGVQDGLDGVNAQLRTREEEKCNHHVVLSLAGSNTIFTPSLCQPVEQWVPWWWLFLKKSTAVRRAPTSSSSWPSSWVILWSIFPGG